MRYVACTFRLPVALTNADVADILRHYAAALALQGADRFKLKAYRRAAETVEGLPESIADMLKSGHDLTELPNIGKAISQVIGEIIETGSLERLDKTVASLPPEQVELLSR